MKLIKKIFAVVCIVCITSACLIGYLGYRQYKDAIAEISIQEKVAQMRTKRDYVSYEDISKDLLDATVAIEDRRFYEHNGVDYFAMARALVTNIFQKDIVGGGSTITQQLAKNMYFGYETSWIRKVSELFVAHDLETQYTKEEILTLYVNIINYGDQHIGIRQASEGYFQVEPKDLSFDQATLLAGLPQSPSNYQLSNHYEQALQRQWYVQKAMVREQMISEDEMALP